MTARRGMDRLAEALIAIEQGVRRRHPDLPEYALVLLSRAHEGRYRGNFQASDAASGAPHRVRVCISLLDPAVSLSSVESLLSTLLHELAHLLAHSRGIADARGDWHTEQFRALARELGLVVEKHGPRYGWARTRLGVRARRQYSDELAELHAALKGVQAAAPAFADRDWILWSGQWLDSEPRRPPSVREDERGPPWWLTDTALWTLIALAVGLWLWAV